ncbi:hypothetical protein MA16_Dca022678 [Dendrobium catenatum]|uniref:Uncharacterized protein n=1 Tax=Dendrobium catenatum TaxID=906689 RepID=A0A2I0W230_9ASPA|nr:hypothetical protein MA16_Dca022678 [Dendrobium catenatum]
MASSLLTRLPKPFTQALVFTEEEETFQFLTHSSFSLLMGKKRNAPAAGTSISKDIHDLKTLNSYLLKEVAELRKQIEHVCSRLDSLIADGDILDSTDHGVRSLVLSSTLGEAEACRNTEIVEATYKALSATAELKDKPEKK